MQSSSTDEMLLDWLLETRPLHSSGLAAHKGFVLLEVVSIL